MSFVGDLEHMPIVDVMQLLHSTRKSGILSVKSRKGESRLVFKDGYIVSANHLNNSLRIGNILLERQLIPRETLETALREQETAGKDRKPLIITLVQNGFVGEEDAYQALEHLIELTVVEILTWKRGTFSLEVAPTQVSDGYRYYPERMSKEINVDTQGVLMDALRIYDEKMRDGTLPEEETADGDAETEGVPAAPESATLTADDLGLGDLDALEKKIPDVFLGVKAYDPAEPHRQELADELKDMPLGAQESLLAFLVTFSRTAKEGTGQASAGPPLAVILLSQDTLIKHAVMTVCRQADIFAFTTDDEANIDHIVDQSLARERLPVLIIDSPERAAEGFTAEKIMELWHQKKARYPQISILQLVTPRDYPFSLQAMGAGLSGIVPRPSKEERNETVATDAIEFMKGLQAWLTTTRSSQEQQVLRLFAERVRELGTLSTAPEISCTILKFAAAMFERSVTLVVARTELIAERGIGIRGEKSAGPTPPLLFKVPLDQPSVLRETVEQGTLFYGQSSDPLLASHLYTEIGAPRSPRILLAPIKSFGRVIALTYCDFGDRADSSIPVDLLDTLSCHAGIVLDNALLRKKFENPVQSH